MELTKMDLLGPACSCMWKRGEEIGFCGGGEVS